MSAAAVIHDAMARLGPDGRNWARTSMGLRKGGLCVLLAIADAASDSTSSPGDFCAACDAFRAAVGLRPGDSIQGWNDQPMRVWKDVSLGLFAALGKVPA